MSTPEIDRCYECGSYDAQCLHSAPVAGCGCCRCLSHALAAAREELEAVQRVEAWLRVNYTRRVTTDDALPDAVLQLVEQGEVRFEARSLAALGRLLKEVE